MKNRVVVITGATRGFGKSLSIAFAGRGYKLIGIYRVDRSAAEELEEEFKVQGWPIKLIGADVKDGCAFIRTEPWIDEAESIVLINNVGPVFEPRPMHLFSWLDYQEMFSATMSGAVHCTFELLPAMLKRKNKCTIVNVASTAASSPPKGFSAYSAAKSALITFSKSLGAEYADRGLRVLTVSPGFMLTPATAAWHSSLRDSITRNQGGALDPQAIAEQVAVLVQNFELPARGEEYMLTSN